MTHPGGRPKEPTEYRPCPNSLNMKHKWREDIGKNKGKPKCCVHCSKLATDLESKAERR